MLKLRTFKLGRLEKFLFKRKKNSQIFYLVESEPEHNLTSSKAIIEPRLNYPSTQLAQCYFEIQAAV